MNARALADYEGGLQALRRDSGADVAVTLMERAAAHDPDSADARAGVAEAYWLKFVGTKVRDSLDRSQEALSAAERRNPDAASVHRMAGLLLANGGRYEAAVEVYKRAIELQPANGDAHRRLGLAYSSTGQSELALAAYRRAVEVDPKHFRNFHALGSYFFLASDFGAAAEHFRQAVALEPAEPTARRILGQTFLNMGRFQEAEAELRAAIAVQETPAAVNTLGTVLTYQGRDQEAVELLARALEKSPQWYRMWMNLGTAYRRLNRLEDAAGAHRRALELVETEVRDNPRRGGVRACLAYLCARLGNTSRAESETAQALSLTPKDSETLWWAIRTYEALQRPDLAIAVLAQAPATVVADVGRHPDLASLHADPRFRQLLDQQQRK